MTDNQQPTTDYNGSNPTDYQRQATDYWDWRARRHAIVTYHDGEPEGLLGRPSPQLLKAWIDNGLVAGGRYTPLQLGAEIMRAGGVEALAKELKVHPRQVSSWRELAGVGFVHAYVPEECHQWMRENAHAVVDWIWRNCRYGGGVDTEWDPTPNEVSS